MQANVELMLFSVSTYFIELLNTDFISARLFGTKANKKKKKEKKKRMAELISARNACV